MSLGPKTVEYLLLIVVREDSNLKATIKDSATMPHYATWLCERVTSSFSPSLFFKLFYYFNPNKAFSSPGRRIDLKLNLHNSWTQFEPFILRCMVMSSMGPYNICLVVRTGFEPVWMIGFAFTQLPLTGYHSATWLTPSFRAVSVLLK